MAHKTTCLLWCVFELLHVSITGFEHFTTVNIIHRTALIEEKELRLILYLKNIVNDSFDFTRAAVNLVTLLQHRNLLFRVQRHRQVGRYHIHSDMTWPRE